MSVSAFIANFAVAKVGKAGNGVASLLARLDPDTASQVDIEELDRQFKALGTEVAKATEEEERTHKIVIDLEARLARTKEAATMIADQISATRQGGGDVTALTENVRKLLGQIKELGGDTGDGKSNGTLFDAIEDHAKAETDLHELQQLHAGAAATLTQYQHTREQAQRDMARAQREEQQAVARQERNERLAGIKSGLQGGSVALQAMQQAAADARTRARAARTNADALGTIVESNKSVDDIVNQTLKGAAPADDPLAELARLTGKAA